MPEWLDKTANSLGFLGSDTFQQLPEQTQQGLSFEQIGVNGVRFAFAVRRDKLEAVRSKLGQGTTVNVVTSYPITARESAGLLGSPVRIVGSPGGSVEAAPTLMPDTDGIIDIVDSGSTLRANGLEIVTELQPVALGALWQAPQRTPEKAMPPDIPVSKLAQAIARIEARVDQSRAGARDSTTQLLAADRQRLTAKLREEVDELIQAFESGTPEEVAQESADVLYPLSIMNSVRGTSTRAALSVFATER